MKKRTKTMLRVLLWIVAIIVILILICFVYHRYKLRKEEKLREPLGQLIDINGNNISIYVEGSGSKTLVFLSGSGTCSPILDFKSLYSLLSDEYRIVVVPVLIRMFFGGIIWLIVDSMPIFLVMTGIVNDIYEIWYIVLGINICFAIGCLVKGLVSYKTKQSA